MFGYQNSNSIKDHEQKVITEVTNSKRSYYTPLWIRDFNSNLETKKLVFSKYYLNDDKLESVFKMNLVELQKETEIIMIVVNKLYGDFLEKEMGWNYCHQSIMCRSCGNSNKFYYVTNSGIIKNVVKVKDNNYSSNPQVFQKTVPKQCKNTQSVIKPCVNDSVIHDNKFVDVNFENITEIHGKFPKILETKSQNKTEITTNSLEKLRITAQKKSYNLIKGSNQKDSFDEINNSKKQLKTYSNYSKKIKENNNCTKNSNQNINKNNVFNKIKKPSTDPKGKISKSLKNKEKNILSSFKKSENLSEDLLSWITDHNLDQSAIKSKQCNSVEEIEADLIQSGVNFKIATETYKNKCKKIFKNSEKISEQILDEQQAKAEHILDELIQNTQLYIPEQYKIDGKVTDLMESLINSLKHSNLNFTYEDKENIDCNGLYFNKSKNFIPTNKNTSQFGIEGSKCLLALGTPQGCTNLNYNLRRRKRVSYFSSRELKKNESLCDVSEETSAKKTKTSFE